MALKSAATLLSGQAGEVHSSEWLPILCLVLALYTVLPDLLSDYYLLSEIANLHWCWCSHWEEVHLSLKHAVLLVQALCLRQGVQLPSLLSLCSVPFTVTLPSHSMYRDTVKLQDARTPLNISLRWLSFENSWVSFCAAEQGEILIKFPSVIWDDFLFGAETNLENVFPFFEQARLDLCLLTLSIYYKWASIYGNFVILINLQKWALLIWLNTFGTELTGLSDIHVTTVQPGATVNVPLPAFPILPKAA